MTKREPVDEHNGRITHSAGGVCYQIVEGQPQVVLIATLGGARWGLPKGQVRQGEEPAAAAAREIEEETGISGSVLQLLDTIEYWFRSGSRRIHKFVDFFLVRYNNGVIVPQLSEVDDASWFPLDEAIAIVSFPRERAILEQVRQLWEQQVLP